MGTRLRPLEDGDRERLRTWRNLPEVARYMRSDRPIGAEEHARWFARIRQDAAVAYWLIELDEAPVGLVNLADIDHAASRCSLGLYLGEPAARGRGVGRHALWFVAWQAFEVLGLSKLACEVLAFNEPALRLYTGCGFKVEGRLRQEVRRADGAHDLILLSMLRAEWEAVRATAGEILGQGPERGG